MSPSVSRYMTCNLSFVQTKSVGLQMYRMISQRHQKDEHWTLHVAQQLVDRSDFVKRQLAFIKSWSFLVPDGWIHQLVKSVIDVQILLREGLQSGDRGRKEGCLEPTQLVSAQDNWCSSFLFKSHLLCVSFTVYERGAAGIIKCTRF